jgi:arylsulfatase A
LGSTLDIFPTSCALAGLDVPSDRAIDGLDLGPALLGDSPSPRDIMFFYRGTRIFAVRKGPFKAHFITKSGYGPDQEAPHDPPLLYHLGHDPAEKFNIAENHPDVIEDILQEVETHRQSVIPVKNQLDERI